jgi:two-component system, OmpR family, sensor histidine kinase KdpD
MHGPPEPQGTTNELMVDPPPDASPLDARAVELLSHELRSPITTIHLGAKVLRSPDVGEPVREAVIEAVDVEAFRLLRVVEDLLVVVRHDAGASTLRVEPILVQRRLDDLVWSDEAAVADVPVRYRMEPGLPAVMADEEALGHALRNLLTNAATHGAGDAPTEVVVEVVGPWLEIAVLDRGPGVDPTETERLFRPFYRSLRAGGVTGAGLGLAAARRLARAMGGDLVASAREGGGAAFTIRLPLAEPEGVAAAD